MTKEVKAKEKALDTTTFEKAISTHKDSIFRICRIYAVDPLEPKDLFQEVVLQAWRSHGNFQQKSAVGTWLYRIALNVCINTKLKLEKRNQQTIVLESISIETGEGDQENDERFKALQACIEMLDDPDRSLVVLYLEELPYKEIGKVLGLTENHVAVKLKRIRKKLFNCITKAL